MQSGLIVYSKIDKDKNSWFINKCIENLANKGVSLVFFDEDEVLGIIHVAIHGRGHSQVIIIIREVRIIVDAIDEERFDGGAGRQDRGPGEDYADIP